VALDGAVVDGNTLRAAYGTTKYCTAFLQHRQCQNPNCMYLHSEQDQDDTESHTREEAVNIQHAVKMGQHPSSKGTTAAAKPPQPEEKPERPILPSSVSWAKAAVGARAHSPPQERVQQDQRHQPIPSSVPSQYSPASAPELPRAPSPPNESSSTELVTPSEISLSLATSDQHSRLALRLFDKILENFQKGSFKFSISSDLLDSDDFKLASQVLPYFEFKKDSFELSETSDAESKDSETKPTEAAFSPKVRGFNPFASTLENGTHKRQQSRFAYVNDPISRALAQPIPSAAPQSQLVRSFSPPRMSDPVLLAQQFHSNHIATTSAGAAAQYKTATPPPPGMYFSHVQQLDQQRRQQLLDQQRSLQNYNPEYGYYPQQQGGPQQSSSRNYNSSLYDDQDHVTPASVYAPQARRHLLDNQGRLSNLRHNLLLDSLQDLNGSLMNMRMSPHLQQGFSGGGQHPQLPQPYGGQPQGGFVGRRYIGSAF
jgi:hypothetical protein